jgi:FMN-dependent NADH-azoreductase
MDSFVFNAEECQRMLDQMEGKEQVTKDKKSIPLPPTSGADKWIDWHEGVVNYFKQCMSYAGVPLVYIIQD